jgi:hypothetical protein
VKGWKLWPTNRSRLQRLVVEVVEVAHLPVATAAVDTVAATAVAGIAAAVTVAHAVKAAPEAVLVVPADRAAASASISAKRKFASFASKKWTS